MTPVGELAYRWRVYAAECDTEIWNTVNAYNAAHSKMSEDEMHQIIRSWQDERVLARDTASYLETLQGLMVKRSLDIAAMPVAQLSYTWNPWGAICVSTRRA